MNLTERLKWELYRDDEPVGIGARGTEPDGWVYVPERLFARLVALGQAYELHLLPVIEVYGETTLTSAQCATLGEELLFLRQVTNDEALHRVVEILIPLVELTARQRKQAIIVAGP